MISIGRLVLSLFAALSVYVDPGQPTGDIALTFGILAAYLVFATVVVILVLLGVRSSRLGILSHVVDIAFFATLIHLTDGVASPFFVYFTFVLFTAAIGWGWRGAAITTAATVAVFLFLTAVGDAALWLHVDRIIIRVSYLIVAGLFFCYFAAIAQASRLRLARLADWPVSQDDAEQPSVLGVLGHAAEILKLSRIVVVWEQDGTAHMAAFVGGKADYRTLPEKPGLDCAGKSRILPAEEVRSLREALPGSLVADIDDEEGCATIPLSGFAPGSCILLFGRGGFGPDFLTLGSIVATRVGVELKRGQLRRQLILTAAAEERAMLARDIHDDLLQSFTAIALRLKTLEAKLPPETKEQVSALRDLVTHQQRQLRLRVMEGRSDPREEGETFAGRIAALAAVLRSQWSCEIDLQLQSETLPFLEKAMRDVELFIAEAVANGVRHGQATRFTVRQQIVSGRLEIGIDDDGEGIEGVVGSFDHEAVMRGRLGSNSLRLRAQALGWRINLSSSGSGTSVMIQIPVPQGDPG